MEISEGKRIYSSIMRRAMELSHEKGAIYQLPGMQRQAAQKSTTRSLNCVSV